MSGVIIESQNVVVLPPMTGLICRSPNDFDNLAKKNQRLQFNALLIQESFRHEPAIIADFRESYYRAEQQTADNWQVVMTALGPIVSLDDYPLNRLKDPEVEWIGLLRPERHTAHELVQANVVSITPTHIIASIPHPNPKFGRFRWAFPVEELPKGEEVKPLPVAEGCELKLDICLDAQSRIQGIVIQGVLQRPRETKEGRSVELVAHEPGDEAGIQQNEMLLRQALRPVIEKARRFREENQDD